MRTEVIYAPGRHLRRKRHLWQIRHLRGNRASRSERCRWRPFSSGLGREHRWWTMRKDVIYAPGPPTRVSCMRGEVIYGTDVMYGR